MRQTNPVHSSRQELLSKMASEMGKISLQYAFQMNKLKIEKEKGLTIISKVEKLELE